MKKRHVSISRRQFLVSTAVVTAGYFLPGLFAAPDESPVIKMRAAAATAKITIQKRRGNVSVLEGSGGNIAVLTGPDGKLLVDAGITASRLAITDTLARIGSDPVKHLINTHWHFDHTDGNEWLHSVGAEITAHENTRKHMSVATRVDGWDFTFPPSPEGALPTRLFDTDYEWYINGTTLRLKHYSPAHTDSDISVEFVNENILHTGDTLWNGHFPFIDYWSGGSIDGAIRAAEANVARVADDTIVVPGHGPVGGKPGLVEFREMLVTIRGKVADLKKQGKPLAEVIEARPTAEFDSKWGQWVIDGKTFASLVYRGV
jgi:glyoxylase-like metal-dependent hydrolase (beta-lactamase superfamily II)